MPPPQPPTPASSPLADGAAGGSVPTPPVCGPPRGLRLVRHRERIGRGEPAQPRARAPLPHARASPPTHNARERTPSHVLQTETWIEAYCPGSQPGFNGTLIPYCVPDFPTSSQLLASSYWALVTMTTGAVVGVGVGGEWLDVGALAVGGISPAADSPTVTATAPRQAALATFCPSPRWGYSLGL